MSDYKFDQFFLDGSKVLFQQDFEQFDVQNRLTELVQEAINEFKEIDAQIDKESPCISNKMYLKSFVQSVYILANFFHKMSGNTGPLHSCLPYALIQGLVELTELHDAGKISAIFVPQEIAAEANAETSGTTSAMRYLKAGAAYTMRRLIVKNELTQKAASEKVAKAISSKRFNPSGKTVIGWFSTCQSKKEANKIDKEFFAKHQTSHCDQTTDVLLDNLKKAFARQRNKDRRKEEERPKRRLAQF